MDVTVASGVGSGVGSGVSVGTDTGVASALAAGAYSAAALSCAGTIVTNGPSVSSGGFSSAGMISVALSRSVSGGAVLVVVDSTAAASASADACRDSSMRWLTLTDTIAMTAATRQTIRPLPISICQRISSAERRAASVPRTALSLSGTARRTSLARFSPQYGHLNRNGENSRLQRRQTMLGIRLIVSSD